MIEFEVFSDFESRKLLKRKVSAIFSARFHGKEIKSSHKQESWGNKYGFSGQLGLCNLPDRNVDFVSCELSKCVEILSLHTRISRNWQEFEMAAPECAPLGKGPAVNPVHG